MITVSVFDTKPYDRRFLQQAAQNSPIEWRFHEFRLSTETAELAKNSPAVCVFVNDHLDRPCLETLSKLGTRLVALRCADGQAQGGEITLGFPRRAGQVRGPDLR